MALEIWQNINDYSYVTSASAVGVCFVSFIYCLFTSRDVVLDFLQIFNL